MADVFNFKPTKVVWDDRHCKLFTDFLSRMENVGVRYVILKNAEGLPYENNSKDIDILIEPGKYKIAADLLKSAYKEHGVAYYRVHKFERLRCWYGFNPHTEFAIHIDLLEGFLHKGFEVFPFDLFYEHSYKNSNGIFVLDELYDNIILLLHSTICYHKIKNKYAKRIASAYTKNKDEIVFVLERVLGKSATEKMCKDLDAENYDAIAQNGRYYSHASKMRIFVRRPFFSIYNICDFLWEKVARLVLNLGRYNVFMSVHAPDGTGKTTFIQEFCQTLGYYYISASEDLIKVYHYRPCLLPNLGAAGEKAGVMKQDKDFTNPHRAKPVGTLSSLIRMTYYVSDYVLGIPMILRRNAQFDTITIFDRYVYDLVVDPARTRISLPEWVRLLFTKIVKKPKLSFVLNTDADTIIKRKQELTLLEIERQLAEFQSMANRWNSRFVVLDASKKPEEIANDAMITFCEKFCNKL